MSARPAVVQSRGRGLAQSRLLACSVTPHAVTFTNSGLIVTLAARLRLPALYPSARWPRAAGFPCSISARNRGRWRWHCPSSQSAGGDDCVAGHVGLELRNVGKNYPFERSRRFSEIQPNSGPRDYSRLSCGGGETQLGISAGISAGFLARALGHRGASPTLQEFLPIHR